ncbi:hypothetical protein LOTGIDRAFT_171119, partial [Lottia gigantea]
ENPAKRLKSLDEVDQSTMKLKTTAHTSPVTPKSELNDPLTDSSASSPTDVSDSDLSSCLKSDSISPMEKPRIHHDSSPDLPNPCQFGTMKSYNQCMPNDQSYYNHHASAVSRVQSSSFLPVSSTTGGLLQPMTSSLFSMNSQMQPCRLSGQSNDCALRQPGLASPSHGYGIRTTPPQHHPSLSSCTYMQSGQPYTSHLTPNMHMMNMNFTGPMA